MLFLRLWRIISKKKEEEEGKKKKKKDTTHLEASSVSSDF